MPEGPHIRNTADDLRAALLDRYIEHCKSRLKKSEIEGWREKIEGSRVVAVRSHGKNLFIDFESGWTLYSHMMMWGSWHVHRLDEEWHKEESRARVVLQTAEAVVVLFSAPVCELLRSDELSNHRTAELGPDFLADTFGVDSQHEIRRRLALHPQESIGEALLNQNVMAGIGNILKSEILFAVKINPLRLSSSLTEQEFERLMEVATDFMRRSYETHGFKKVFLPPDLQEKVTGLGYVYGRSRRPCLVCDTPIVMVRQGKTNRKTFYCPHCQPEKSGPER
ncbi:Fpg/Nei family DNA glycosylase [Pelotalea chapellei]|uniref:DNA-(apurinic or apyrimidinic site) lyase n=1 Tax=Pelotalea chapellei TaxID=44671 RepID=A0ABS5U924_9BACT|nr:DNA-formamidopyrimidine glycosylase family protein [Pelotalea chapellei]MBT1072176.1 hypothetical protein [Pelotalea chapellei]